MPTPTSADEIARPLDDELRRDGAVALLDGRWDKPLTLITAPGGYGKTRVLAQAVRSNTEDPVGIEFYLRVRPGHVDPARLGSAILEAFGTHDGSVDEAVLAERIADEFAALSPTKVVLILDDVHQIETSALAVSLIVEVLRLLPMNGHLLLAGRKMPELPLARLHADDGVIEIGEPELVFDDAEIAALAETHDVDAGMLAQLAGWPALVRLAVAAGKSGPQAFLMQEIVDDLAPEAVRGLCVATLAGTADEDLFSRCGVEVSPSHLAELVPMVDISADGVVRPHELWSEVVAELDDRDALGETVTEIAGWHSDNSRHDDAIMLATSFDATDVARASLMRALQGSDAYIASGSTGRWLELFGGSDSIDEGDAELLLLRGWHARLAHGPGFGDEDVTAALALFHDRGDAHGEACASVEHAFRGFLAGEVGPVLDAVARSPRLVESGVEFLQPLGEMTQAIIAELSGDFHRALNHSTNAVSASMRNEFMELALRHRATLWFLVGDGDAAVEATRDLATRHPSRYNELLDKFARFANGDIADLVESWHEIRYEESGNKRDDFTFAFASVFVDACLGMTPDLAIVRSVAWERPRERVELALCEWSAQLIAGNEEEANAGLAVEIAEIGLSDPLVQGEIRRFIVSGYVAVPEVRDYFNSPPVEPPLGVYHHERLELARILVALREDSQPDWSAYRGPQHTIGSMSLPWSVELACGLVLFDEGRGRELVDVLFEFTGSRAQDWLRRLADREGSVGRGARKLLSLLPAPPGEITLVALQGDTQMQRGGTTYPIARVRVRQLLQLLVLRESVSRDAAMTALWPDKDIDKARNNFRITLSHLRDELEPERKTGEPSYHLLARGDDVYLRRSDHLLVDVWDLRDALAAAEAAPVVGDRSARLDVLAPAVQRWQPPVLPDLRDVHGVGAEVAAFEAKLRDATVEVAEACLSAGRNEEAESLGDKLLRHDEYDERAHAIVIAAFLGSERQAQARLAIDRCLAMLAELDVAPAASTRMLFRRARYPEDASRRTA